MKQLVKTLKHYYLFSAALVASAVALPLDLLGYDTIAHWILIVMSLTALVPLLWGMWQDLRSGTYGVDILAATAIVSAVLLHQYWAGIVVVLMLTGGEALENYANRRAERELEALLSQAPQQAHVLRGRKEVTVKASEVRKGDKLVIRPGELVPVDAVILEGSTTVDESSLTGESLPQPKDSNEQLLSGSVNLDGSITAKATASAEDSQYQQIVKLVKSARNSQAPFVRLADRYAIPFTIVSFAIAGSVWAVSGDAIRFLEVIVVATPCPLILAAPIAIISGMSRSAKKGIIVKNGASLEKLAQANIFAFDKTGTLTRGILKVEKVTTYGKQRRSEVLALAAGLERHSNHVQAAAIIQKAEAEHAKPASIKHVREIAGKGLAATANGKEILIGRLLLLEERGVSMPKTFKASAHDRTTAYLAVNGELAAAIEFEDEIRPESKAMLDRLRAAGVKHFMMITGDNQRTAGITAKKLGIQTVVAEALPGDKILAVEKLTDRPVAFVGDGVNDAPVLTASDVGIALGARGSAAAAESADVVIMQDDITHVAEGVAIAKRTLNIASQSILIGIGLSIGLMAVFATGKFTPIWGAAIQEVVDIVVIFNALRAHTAGK
jgi:heavy metal translocating P-type ATPase